MTLDDVLRAVALQLDLIFRLGVASGLGAVIGAQREVHGSPAGLRTHLLVAFGSALFTIVSAYAFSGPTGSGNAATTYDPTRVAAQIVTGIGFIGAGAIIKDGATIRGLTTAASLWAVAAIGMAVGAGAIVLSVVATGIMLLSLGPLGRLSHRLARTPAVSIHAKLRITGLNTIEGVVARMTDEGMIVTHVVTKPIDGHSFDVDLTMQAEDEIAATRAVSVILASDDIETVETAVGTSIS